ncbi:hypothetical protein [Mesorhizobium sp. B2-4-10]|uniref:hypothetical protein n=1 Tax=Mesorhizobium sp. B2-4-10 TaxID=2589939 RepID=UPI00112ECDD3|nr:hypothetical protein [Mesorhizobium sp. B2-4-10]
MANQSPFENSLITGKNWEFARNERFAWGGKSILHSDVSYLAEHSLRGGSGKFAPDIRKITQPGMIHQGNRLSLRGI